MTKSTITRERLEEWVAQFDEDGGCDATDRQLEALIRQSLAAMDSEPVQMFGIGSIFKPQRVIEQEADCDDCAHYNPKICHGEGCPAISQQSAQPAPDDVQRDAKRWRALLGSARIRILGSAGFDATAHPGENPDYRHFGMEIWTHHPDWPHEKNEYGINTLIQYADAMLAAAPQEVNHG